MGKTNRKSSSDPRDKKALVKSGLDSSPLASLGQGGQEKLEGVGIGIGLAGTLSRPEALGCSLTAYQRRVPSAEQLLLAELHPHQVWPAFLSEPRLNPTLGINFFSQFGWN